MTHTSCIVLDGFYDEPDAVREAALAGDWVRPPGVDYPGRTVTIESFAWRPVWERLRARIDEPVGLDGPKPVPFEQGKFRLALARDEGDRTDRVHLDVQRWSGIVYLTPNRWARDGLALYVHKPTRSTTWDEAWFRAHYGWYYLLPPDELRKRMQEFFRDPEQFEQIGLIPMRYNRAVLLMAHAYHGTGLAFGDRDETGRLSQHFEFYEARGPE